MDPERVVIDTERVIEEVRARPQIWDPAHELYKSREARQEAWSTVTAAVVYELHDLSRPDQREIEKKIQQRWRTARDSFVKMRAQLLGGGVGGSRGGGVGRVEKTCGYYHAMTFLEPTLRLPLKVQKGMAPATVGQHAPSPAATAATTATAARGRRKRTRLSNGACPIGEPAAAPAASEELSPLERKLVSLVAARSGPLDEDDDNFFKSLAPLLRTLPTHQKLAFRSRVLALALEVQGRALQNPFLEVAMCSPDSEDDALETKYRPPAEDLSDG